jgi:hypothetical protein
MRRPRAPTVAFLPAPGWLSLCALAFSVRDATMSSSSRMVPDGEDALPFGFDFDPDTRSEGFAGVEDFGAFSVMPSPRSPDRQPPTHGTYGSRRT